MKMLLFVPLSDMIKLVVDQLVVVRSEFCCKTKSVEGDGHEIMTLLPE